MYGSQERTLIHIFTASLCPKQQIVVEDVAGQHPPQFLSSSVPQQSMQTLNKHRKHIHSVASTVELHRVLLVHQRIPARFSFPGQEDEEGLVGAAEPFRF